MAHFHGLHIGRCPGCRRDHILLIAYVVTRHYSTASWEAAALCCPYCETTWAHYRDGL